MKSLLTSKAFHALWWALRLIGSSYFLVACGGGSSTPLLPNSQTLSSLAIAVTSPTPTFNPLSAFVPVNLSYTLPQQQTQNSQSRTNRRLQYISTANASLTVVVTPVGGTPMSPVIGSCTTITCAVSFTANPGLNSLAFTLTDTAGGGGNILSTFTSMVLVQPGVLNTLAFTANPVVNSVTLQLASNSTAAGSAADVALTVNALDAAGKTIVGPGNYVDVGGNPLALTLAVSLNQAGGSGTATIRGPLRITGPGQGATYVHYDGNWLSSAAISVSSSRAIAGSLGGTTLTTIGKVTNEYNVPTAGSVPWGIITGADEKLWFTEKNGNQVGRATTSGVITEYLIPTASCTPNELTLGPDGNVWITEQWSNKIARITPNGTISEFSITGSADNLTGITVGSDGNIWFNKFNPTTILRITTSGIYTTFSASASAAKPATIVAGPDGNLWYTEYNLNSIGRMNTLGIYTEFSVPTPASALRNIAVGPDNNLWFTEQSGNKIGRITPSGTITEFTVPTAGAQPWGITAGPDGKLWFTEFNTDKIASITTSGVITEYTVPTGNSNPYGITVGPDNNIWFTESNQNKIARFIL